MPCKEKDALLRRYEEAVETYSGAVIQMAGSPQIKAAFEELWNMVEKTRLACEAAQRLLDQHENRHGC